MLSSEEKIELKVEFQFGSTKKRNIFKYKTCSYFIQFHFHFWSLKEWFFHMNFINYILLRIYDVKQQSCESLNI